MIPRGDDVVIQITHPEIEAAIAQANVEVAQEREAHEKTRGELDEANSTIEGAREMIDEQVEFFQKVMLNEKGEEEKISLGKFKERLEDFTAKAKHTRTWRNSSDFEVLSTLQEALKFIEPEGEVRYIEKRVVETVPVLPNGLTINGVRYERQ